MSVQPTLDALRHYLLAKPETEETFPFGEDVYVYKVNHKMFALIGFHQNMRMLNVKSEPSDAAVLCDMFSAITPGYHMDKRHWISIYFTGEVPSSEIWRLIDLSYLLVVGKMPKRDQARIMALGTHSHGN